MKLDEPSAKLDLAVAEAVGIDATVFNIPGINQPGCHINPEAWTTFAPSSDMNDATEAAEKAFPGGWTLSSRPDIDRTQYAFFSHANPGTITGELTGPLAICALILESKAS